MVRAKQIVFPAPNQVKLEEVEFDDVPKNGEIIIKGIASIISAGTELACFSGRAKWAQFPFRPGYGMIGQVIGLGKDVEGLKEGDLVLTHSNHASYSKAQVIAVKVPEGLDPFKAVFARMADVSITALRVSNAELGDRVAVIGLGLVGNLAAQLFALAGCDVIGIDRVKRRLEIAKACGIDKVVNADEINPVEAVKELTDGEGCEVVVDATGIPEVSATAWQYCAPYGEVILLGSYFNRSYQMDVRELLEKIHLSEYGCITYKGAHEWRYPVKDTRKDFFILGWPKFERQKHSVERNAKINLSMIAKGKLIVEPLLTHRLKPEECETAYLGLRDNPEEFLGVVFDWR
ncbi:zinc-binding alcohol dehydrogenase [bacterium]|nr:zinc-binding alcohol dehydrogenase [bacterium]